MAVHKGVLPLVVRNYTPVSLLNVLCEVLEGIIREQVYLLRKEHTMVCSDRHAFRDVDLVIHICYAV